MRLYYYFIFFLILLQACNKGVKKVENINLQVEINLIDTINFLGNEEMIFTNHIHPINQNEDKLIAFDLITHRLLDFRPIGNAFFIEQTFDIQQWLLHFSFMRANHYRVVEVFDNNILICSFPYYILLDQQLEPIDSFEVEDVTDSIPFHSQGSNYDIVVSSDKMRVYHNVAPLVPASMEEYFSASRIVEINLATQQSRFLPVGLPADYESGLGYQQLGMPCFTIHNEELFAIYPGSNFLYSYDPITDVTDSVFVLPEHVELNVVLGDDFLDKVMYGPFESNTFYHMVSFGDYILVFYREGESREKITSSGLTALKSYVMGYDPSEKKILFDTPFLAGDNVSKIPYWVDNSLLYFPYLGDEDSFDHKLMVYEILPELLKRTND